MLKMEDLLNEGSRPSRYAKKPQKFEVTFAPVAQTLQTKEGAVKCMAGDAIVTGIQGERWPVPRSTFDRKYVAVAPTVPGEPGRYQTLRSEVLALRLDSDVSIDLSGGRGALVGHPGDWLVQYAPGDQSIVGATIFLETYELVTDSVPLIVGVAGNVDELTRDQMLKLAKLLPHTPVFILSTGENGEMQSREIAIADGPSIRPAATSKCRLQPTDLPPVSVQEHQAVYLLKHSSFIIHPAENKDHLLDKFLGRHSKTLPYWTIKTDDQSSCGVPEDLFDLPQPAPVFGAEGFAALLGRLEADRRRGTVMRATRRFFRSLLPQPLTWWRSLTLRPEHKEPLEASRFWHLMAAQLEQLDTFNSEAAQLLMSSQVKQPNTINAEAEQCKAQEEAQAVSERNSGRGAEYSLGRDRYTPIERLHVIADHLAGRNQDAWQKLVYSTTKNLATVGGLLRASFYTGLGGLFGIWMQRLASLAGLGLIATIAFATFTELGEPCQANDPFGFLGCSTEAWEHWARPAFFAIYLAAMLLAFMRYVVAKSAEYERKHQDYRLLAECLRVQHVWSRSGIPHYVADALPSSEISESSWVQNAVRAVRWQHSKNIGEWNRTSAEWAVCAFIDDQVNYHTKTLIGRRETAARYLAARARAALGLFLICVIVLSANIFSEKLFRHRFEGVLYHLVVVFTVGMLGIWAANKKILENFGLEAEVRRGRAVLAALEAAKKVIQEQMDEGASSMSAGGLVSATFMGVGRAFVRDQATWHAMHRSRPVEAVTGG